jgi:hypothetical protein
MRCWWCGVEPDDVHTLEITSLGDAKPRYLTNIDWPDAGDHDHAEKPPMPGELLEYGSRCFDRITQIVAE